MSKNKVLKLSLLIVVFIIAIIAIVFFTNKLNNGNTKEIEQFLTSEKVISTENVVGAGNPEIYYFTDDGKVAYIAQPYFTKEGETISFIGTWKIENNKIILTVQKENKVKGGTIVEAAASDPYDYLENYEEIISTVNYTIEFEIEEFIKDENNGDYLKLDKNNFYQLNIDKEDTETIRKLAINGYV